MSIAENILHVRTAIEAAAREYGRDPGATQLIGIAKKKDEGAVREAYRAGLTQIGESYVQEAVAKVRRLADLDITWHFVGPIQSNKTRAIAEHFAWVHSVASTRVAERLNRQRPDDLPPLRVLIQVNLDGAPTKTGVGEADLVPLAETILALPRLECRGLMTLPERSVSIEAQRLPFRRLSELLADLREQFPAASGLSHLSMGMSTDLRAAVAEGATFVRIGTAIFGERD